MGLRRFTGEGNSRQQELIRGLGFRVSGFGD